MGEDNQQRYFAPWIPAIMGYILYVSNYWMIPYWIIMFSIYMVKSVMIFEGVNSTDWVFLFLWIPAQMLTIHFGNQMLKLANCTHFWVFVFSSLTILFFTVYFFTVAQTVLFFESFISKITLFILGFEFLLGFISFFIQRRPLRISPE